MVVSLNTSENLLKTSRKIYQCPKCKSESNVRVHRTFLVKTLLFWLPIRRYACHGCKRKFHVWR